MADVINPVLDAGAAFVTARKELVVDVLRNPGSTYHDEHPLVKARNDAEDALVAAIVRHMDAGSPRCIADSRARVVGGVLDLYEPLSGKHSRMETDTITVFEPIKRGQPVRVLIGGDDD